MTQSRIVYTYTGVLGRLGARGLRRLLVGRSPIPAPAVFADLDHWYRGRLLRRFQEQLRLRPAVGGAQDLGSDRQ